MLQTRHSPIIVGERYELAETADQGGEHHGGLLAKSEYQTALLSMSNYGRHASSDLNTYGARKSLHTYASLADYNAERSAPEANFFLQSQHGLSDSSSPQSVAMAYNRDKHRASYGGPGPYYTPSASYESTPSQFDEYSVRKAPEVQRYNPKAGSRGTRIYIYIRAEYDLLAHSASLCNVFFADYPTPASLSRLDTQGATFEYVVAVDAPPFTETGSPNTQVQLRLQLQQQNSGDDVANVEVGCFQYSTPILSSSEDMSRKRKLSMESGDSAYSMGSHSTYAYPPSLHSVDLDPLQGRNGVYNRNQHQFRNITARRGTQDFAAVNSLMHPPPSQASSYGRSYPMSNPVQDTGSSPANPPLIRTSTIQQLSPRNGTTNSSFNPYTMYPQKAVLKLRGDLNSMTENWTADEWASKRRLVQFHRSQSGSTINAEFAPVRPEERQPNSICISCIWWEERQECFATSVDSIYLLEQLIAARFTVEEKNRIRRNLEGFKPLTVSKGKSDSEEFFKIIMGFPNPKPRNIEKDVKVFEWKILAGALKKIISKYSSSHASTAGSLSQNRSSLYNNTSGFSSDQATDRFGLGKQITSRPSSNSTGSSNGPYVAGTPQPLKSSTMTPMQTPHSGHHHYGAEPLSGSSLSHGFGTVSPHLQQQHHGHSVPSLPQAYTVAPLVRSHSSRGVSETDYAESHEHRYAKRPRANTSATPMYHAPSDEASYQIHSRSFSEQPVDLRAAPAPGLGEGGYSGTSEAGETQYIAQSQGNPQDMSQQQSQQQQPQQQPPPHNDHAVLPSPARESYGFS